MKLSAQGKIIALDRDRSIRQRHYFVRIMKLTSILLLAACLQLSARGLSQTVSLTVKDAPLLTVLRSIEKQTGYSFILDNQWLKKTKKVSITVNHLPLTQVLDLCFQEQPLTYEITGKVILVKLKPESSHVQIETKPQDEAGLIDVKGRITDSSGHPIANATVNVKGTNKSTTTNSNGEFSINGVDEHATLIITHVQYESAMIAVNGRHSLTTILQIKVSPLDEMQVIAYGSTSKRLQTGNVATVKAEDIAKQPVSNPLMALEARVPGVFITQTSGYPGSGVTVRIQGLNSIGNGNDPLYVVDGVPYTAQLLPSLGSLLGNSGGRPVNSAGTYGSPLNFINPSDIESIEILKDADATAIYGSQAANGAILITTKKGKSGEQKVEFNLQQGWGKVTRTLDLLNRRQYLDMRYEALKNDGVTLSSLDKTSNYDLTVWDTTRSTDWQKELIGNTAKYTDLQSTVSGGNNSTYYQIGAGYHRETLVIPGDFSDQKGSLHAQINSSSANQKFHLTFKNVYVFDVNRLPNANNSGDLTAIAMQLPATAPNPYNSDGSINWELNPAGKSTWQSGNPIAQLLGLYKNTTSNLVSNLVLDYQLIQGLNFKTNLGFTNLQTKELTTVPLTSIPPEMRASSSRYSFYYNSSINSWIIEPQLIYDKVFSKSKLQVLAGSSIQQRNSNEDRVFGSGYISDDALTDIHAAARLQSLPSFQFVYKYNGVFGRINYTWNQKFIFNLTGRRDGSSRFGVQNQFHNFGAVAGAWVFSEEKFIRQVLHSLSFGKVKISYGTSGNDQIGEYQYLSAYNPVSVGNSYQGISTLQVTNLANPYLEWEETRKFSAGIDLGFNKDKVIFNITYFNNRSSNQLLPYNLPATTGFNSITENFPATVRNSGFELTISTTNLETKDFKWSTNLNVTVPRNKLIAFQNLANSSYANTYIIGQPITILKKFHLVGVDPATGAYYFSSKTNPVSPVSPDDATAIVNPAPSWFGGLENTVRYKSLQLSFLFQFVKQIGPDYSLGFLPGSWGTNQPDWVLDRWQKPGDIATHQKFNSNYSLVNQFYNASLSSDGTYSDASYIRLKNISLSWQLPASMMSRLHLNNLRLYTQAQNLLTFTHYKGLDPETLSSTTLPPLRVLTVGIQVTL